MLGSTGENLLPEVHLGLMFLCPGHHRIVVKNQIFPISLRYCSPLETRAEKVQSYVEH